MSGALGLEIDTSKGQVLSITPLGCDPAGAWSDCFFLEGVTVDLDVGYEIALVEDSSQAMGMGVGNETKGGAVMFVNVDPGAVVPTMTAPSGYSCDYIPPSIEVVAMGYHEVSVYCPPE